MRNFLNKIQILKTNVTYIISDINKALAFEWIAEHLDKSKFNLSFILLNPGTSELENYLKHHRIPVQRVTYRGKKDIPKSVFAIYKILKKNKTDVVHTHLFNANIAGLTAAWLAGIKKRIHTRHHSDYHHVYHPKAVRYDRIINSLSTDIVAISRIVEEILIHKENVEKQKIHLIHHGFKLADFSREKPENALSKKYNPVQASPVIGAISRYLELKGIEYIIAAFKELLKDYPNALLILANAEGDYKKQIKAALGSLPGKNYIEISFEPDVYSLYQLFDVFIHVPVAKTIEAFGQTYVEALAAGIPSVFTLSGVANEFIVDQHNAMVVPYKDSNAIYRSVKKLLEDKTITDQLIINGKKDVSEKFELDKMILSLEHLYER